MQRNSFRKSKLWVLLFVICTLGLLAAAAGLVIHVDPFFHYHAPDTDSYFYPLNNERSQNDGIARHFTYDALITGTSMTENFKTSEMDDIFGVTSIKVPYAGASFKEINEIVQTALSAHPEVKIVIRGLDSAKFFDRSDAVRTDLGDPPTYLYDKNIFNDVKYVFNRDVLLTRVYSMLTERNKEGFVPGITSFDDYANWMRSFTFGRESVYAGAITDPNEDASPREDASLTDEERERILENIRQNVTSITTQYPHTQFYYFFTPCSAAWWQTIRQQGKFRKQMEAERLIIEELLAYDNIRLFSFQNRTEITDDLNHFKDARHYGSWVNSLMLKWMHEGTCLLTRDNYEDYLQWEISHYTDFDYNSLYSQEDYEDDYYAAALVREELTGIAPLPFTKEILEKGRLQSASWLEIGQGDGFLCTGTLDRKSGSEIPVEAYLIQDGYNGWKGVLPHAEDYDYLVFTGQKIADHGHPRVYVYDAQGQLAASFVRAYGKIDNEPHRYTMDLSNVSGEVTIIFHGGYIDTTGRSTSAYVFRDICLY